MVYKKGVPLNLSHFVIRAIDSGDLKQKAISKEEFMHLLENKIEGIAFKSVRDDIVRFVRDDKALDIWSASYLSELIKKIKFL